MHHPHDSSPGGEEAGHIALSNQLLDRNRREVELLAAIADSPREAHRLLREQGINLYSFTAQDTRAIFMVLDQAGAPTGTPWTLQMMVDAAINLLEEHNLYDPHDSRSFASGSRWGTKSLIRLFTCCPFDQQVVGQCIESLKQRANYGML